ncbi:hypothetical protein BRM91_05600 [Xanthomonas oryzae pv. oryzae]|nr:hypothetical protein BRM91_05600 [Xanthomonas oryzae pv. oryzae]
MALRANLGFRLIATATHAGNQWLATYGDCPRYSSEAGESVVQRFLRACSRSPEQQCQERQVDELQAGIEPSLAVLP